MQCVKFRRSQTVSQLIKRLINELDKMPKSAKVLVVALQYKHKDFCFCWLIVSFRGLGHLGQALCLLVSFYYFIDKNWYVVVNEWNIFIKCESNH